MSASLFQIIILIKIYFNAKWLDGPTKMKQMQHSYYEEHHSKQHTQIAFSAHTFMA